MKRRYWILVLLPALCVLLLSACSKRTTNVSKPVGQEKASAAASIALTVSSARYRAEYFSSDKLSIVSAAAADGGACYLWGRNFQNEVEANWLIRYNPDKTAEESQLALSAGGYITALTVSGGEAYYLERVDAEDGTAAWFLHTSQEAKKLDWANESNLFENLVVSEKLTYFTDGETLYTVSLPDGAVVSTVCAETEITALLCKTDDTIIAYCEETGNLYELDGDTLTKTGTLPLLFYNSKLLPGANSGFDCLVLGRTELFGWNIDEEAATQLLSFDTYGLVSSNISALAPLEGSSFVGATWKSGELEDRLFWLSPSEEPEDLGSERVLKIAGLGRPMVLSSAIADFKALRPECTVEYTDYAERYGEQALQQLQIDLTQGNAPDLLFLNGLPFEAYGKRGLLEDLYPLIDADESVDRGDFTENLLSELESSEHSFFRRSSSRKRTRFLTARFPIRAIRTRRADASI